MIFKEDYINLLKNTTRISHPQNKLKLITDVEEIEKFENETGIQIGCVLNYPFYVMRADLYENIVSGKRFRYCNVEYNNDKPGAASLIIIHDKDNSYLLLLKSFRPFVDEICFELTRGFADPLNDNSSLNTALRELLEETSIDISKVRHDVKKIGTVFPDTGLSNNKVDLYKIEIFVDKETITLENQDEDEIISGYNLINVKNLSSIIPNIKDSFTLAALAKSFL